MNLLLNMWQQLCVSFNSISCNWKWWSLIPLVSLGNVTVVFGASRDSFQDQSELGKFVSLHHWWILHATGQSEAWPVNFTDKSITWIILTSAVLIHLCLTFSPACGWAATTFKLQPVLSVTSQSYLDYLSLYRTSHIDQALCYNKLIIKVSVWFSDTLDFDSTPCSLRSAYPPCRESTESPCPDSGQRSKHHHPQPPQTASRVWGQWRFMYPSDRKWSNVCGQAHSS